MVEKQSVKEIVEQIVNTVSESSYSYFKRHYQAEALEQFYEMLAKILQKNLAGIKFSTDKLQRLVKLALEVIEHKLVNENPANLAIEHNQFQEVLEKLFYQEYNWFNKIQKVPLLDNFYESPLILNVLIETISEPNFDESKKKEFSFELFLFEMINNILQAETLVAGEQFDTKYLIDILYHEQVIQEISLPIIDKLVFIRSIYQDYLAAAPKRLSEEQERLREEFLRPSAYLEDVESDDISKDMLSKGYKLYEAKKENLKRQHDQYRKKLQIICNVFDKFCQNSVQAYVNQVVGYKWQTLLKIASLQNIIEQGLKNYYNLPTNIRRLNQQDKERFFISDEFKDNVRKVKQTLLLHKPENCAWALNQYYDEALVLVREIKQKLELHNFSFISRDLLDYIDDEHKKSFFELEKQREIHAFNVLRKDHPAPILFRQQEYYGIQGLINKLEEKGNEFAAIPETTSQGNALLALSEKLDDKARSHYATFHPRSDYKYVLNNNHLPTQLFKKTIVQEIDQTFEYETTMQKPEFKKLYIDILNIVATIFFPVILLKKLFTDTWHFQKTTATQDLLADAKKDLQRTLTVKV